MEPLLRKARAKWPRRHDVPPACYQIARSLDDALGAAKCVESWLEELADVDLGPDGEHVVAMALSNIRAVRSFLRRKERNGA